MLARLAAREERVQRTDNELLSRARKLIARYLPDHAGRTAPASVRWVTNQNGRWGSCTPDDGSIRISHRLKGVPTYVLDYVLVHELAHLLESGHTPAFWAWVDRYPRAEKAKGYLEGYSAAARLEPPPGVDEDPVEDPADD
jgi:predicted metal-dependent hydrolase